METTTPPEKRALELGDIIEITAPANTEIDNQVWAITYIDDSKIKLIHVSSFQEYTLDLLEDGSGFTDETIQQIAVLCRCKEKGFARQNALLTGSWVDVHFGGEIPAVISGEITNLEEDMIEITTFPERRVIYIDFEYKGLPQDMPIDKIVLRDRPESVGTLLPKSVDEEEGPVAEEEEPSLEYTETGEAAIFLPEGTRAEPITREILQQYYLESNEIVEEELEAITRVVEVPESQRRYTLDAQLMDLTDELLSKYPVSERTYLVFQNIYHLVHKFRQLRSQFSVFGETDNVVGVLRMGAFHKPLVERMEALDTYCRWILPVVKQKNIIHNGRNGDFQVDSPDITYVDNADIILSISNIQTQYAGNTTDGGNANKYDSMVKELTRELAHFTAPSNTDTILSQTVDVKTPIECIVNNTGNFYSTVVKSIDGPDKSAEGRTRFVVRRYGLGDSKIVSEEVRGGHGIRKQYLREPITPNDTPYIESLLVFPESVIRYSRVASPGTSIGDKVWLSQLSVDWSRILKPKTKIDTVEVADTLKEIEYDSLNDVSEGKRAFLGGVKEYRLTPELRIGETTFHQFLSVVFPKKRLLVDFAKETIRGGFSIADMVRVMEPFGMYSGDITFSQYKDMRYFVKESVKTHKANLKKQESAFGVFKTAAYGWYWTGNRIETILGETPELASKFQRSYGFKELKSSEIIPYMSTAESLQRIYGVDGGKMYLRLINKMLLSLITPDKLIQTVELGKLDDMTNLEKIRASPCFQRFIVKKYTALDALRKDNNNDDVFYDSEYDDTPYDILKKYKDKKREMLPESFFAFFRQALVDKHDCPESLAKDLAETIILGKKRVKEGYALLELKPELPESVDETRLSTKERQEIRIEADARKRMNYYKRVGNHWVRDETVDETSFIDNNTLLCNINRECIQTTPSKVCAPNATAGLKMKTTLLQRMQKEFDSRISMSVEELTDEIEESIRRLDSMVLRGRILAGVMDRKYNDYSVSLGKRAVEITNVESPYEPLRRMIMSQTDFVKKQMDIMRFVANFAREPAIDKNESQHWWYCLETNTKLFPNSLYVLARAFVLADNYFETLDRVCAEVGELSADGDCIIDKHAHCVLRQIDFSAEEGFDESGFRIITNQVLERDLGEALQEAFRQQDKVFDSAEKQHAYNIFTTLSGHIGIRDHAVVGELEEFVLRLTLELMNDTGVVLSEKSYLKRVEKKAKESKDKPMVPYAIYRNQLLFMCVSTTTAIALMTLIPSFRTKKTFPGCVQSFTGYPVDAGEENLGGLKYIACLLFKSKSPIEPWKAIEPWSSNIILKRMKDFVKDQLLPRADIQRMCSLKREYLTVHPDEEVPAELSVAKWVRFQPPLVDFSIVKTVQGVGADFESDLLTAIRQGHRQQADSLGVLKSKVLKHVYGVVELIRDVVSKKEMLMTTASKEPFVENACCNEDRSKIQPMSYFIGENATIRQWLVKTDDMAGMIRRIEALAKPQMMFDDENTAIQRGQVRSDLGDHAIYGAMIHYCHFDRDIPIPPELEVVCNQKPAVYDRLDSLDVKIEKMKSNGIRYTKADLERLMAIVNGQNRFSAYLGVQCENVSQIVVFKDILNALDDRDSEIIDARLRQLLANTLADYNPKVMVSEERESTDRLNRHLREINGRMYTKITEFLDKHGNLANAQYDRLQAWIHTICHWSFDSETDTRSIYRIHRFVLESIESMVRVFPAVIVNQSNSVNIPIHWGLDRFHEEDLKDKLKTDRTKWMRFSKNKSIQHLFSYVQSRLVLLPAFVRHLPIFEAIVKDGQTFHSLFTRETVHLLLKYSWYSVLYEYVIGTDEAEVIQVDRQEVVRQRRERAVMTEVFGQESDNDSDTEDSPLMEVQIELGDVRKVKDEVGGLLVMMLNHDIDTKAATNLSYDDIRFKTQRKRDKEKAQITGAFERMERDERKVEDMLKQFKIGRWNVGQQKGLFTYSSETYARQKELNQYLNASEGEAIELTMIPERDGAETQEYDVEALEREDAAEVDREYEAEANDIAGLDEDYYDGNYYEEDREDDIWS